MKVYEMTIADIASEIFDKGEDFAIQIFDDINELARNKFIEINLLKQQLDEKDKQIDIISRDNNLYKYNIDEQKRIIDDFTKQLAEKDKEIESLKQQLAELKQKAIVPKFKRNDFVYAIFTKTQIYKGQIDAFDYYTNSYLVFPNEDVGNEWIEADKVFKSKAEAQVKLQELRGGE